MGHIWGHIWPYIDTETGQIWGQICQFSGINRSYLGSDMAVYRVAG